MATERTVAFRPDEARGCEKCGFAYLFELLDDYYPAPNAAFFACDPDGRIVDCGKGSFELTGLTTEKAIGRPIRDALGLEFEDGDRPRADRARMGGPRPGQAGGSARQRRPSDPGGSRHLPRVRRRRGRRAGGPHARQRPLTAAPPGGPLASANAMTDRQRNVFILALVVGLIAASFVRDQRTKQDAARPRSEGRRPARLPGRADAPDARGHAGRAVAARSTSCASASTSSACPSRRSRPRAATRSRPACRTSRTRRAPSS